LALMIVNGGKLQLNEKNKVSFGDMSGISSWAVKEVGIAASWQIIKGYEDGNFQPQAAVTRAEACRMIVNFLNLQEAKAPVGKIS
ncbi:MAG: S-layer homology domain-containing protein, partial [Clostridiales bacterium]